MRFSLKQLEVFLAVVQHGSTLAASQALGISQPAVSSSVAGLEANLDTKLFYRWKKRMVISESGRMLLPKARRLLENAREVDQVFQGNEDNQIGGTLRLGASRTMASYVMPEILAAFATQHPGVTVEVVSRNKTGIKQLIEDFSLDIGVVAGGGSLANIKAYQWLTDELCVFCSPHHPLAAKKTVTVDDLVSADWVTREEGSGTLELFYSALPADFRPVRVSMVLDNIESIKRTVERMEVLSCVSQFAIRREVADGTLTELKIPDLNLQREYSFLVHREKERSVLLNYFIRHCSQFPLV